MTPTTDLRMRRALQLLGVEEDVPDATTLADALWLARVLPEKSDEPKSALSPPVRSEGTTDQKSEAVPSVGSTNFVNTKDELAKRTGLFAPETAKGEESDMAATAVPVPAGRALPNRLQLERSLKPLLRKYASRRVQVLDEDETVEATAQATKVDQLALRFRPAAERWFDVALVIEQGDGMDVWADTLLELEQLFGRHGGFRRARSLRYQVLEKSVRLTSAKGIHTPHGVLIDPEGRSLVLMVTNGTSDEWNGRVLVDFVRRLGRCGAVGILRTVPKRMWPFTALGDTGDWVRAHETAARNSQIEAEDPFTGLWVRTIGADCVPMFTLEADRLNTWARFVQSPRRVMHEAVRLGIRPTTSKQSGAPQPAADQLVRDFRAKASPEAFQLLRYLAGAPLTLPVMRLVQEALPGKKEQVHLAEVILSGLIERVTPPDPLAKIDRVFYEFVPGVREYLLHRHSGLERLAIERSLSPMQERLRQLVEEKTGSSVKDFRALLLDPEGTERLPGSARMFVDVSRTIYEQWAGGEATSERTSSEILTDSVVPGGERARVDQGESKGPYDRGAEPHEEDEESAQGPHRVRVRCIREVGGSSAIVFISGDEWGRFPDYLALPGSIPGWSVWQIDFDRGLDLGSQNWMDGFSPYSDMLGPVFGNGPLEKYGSLAFCAHGALGLVLQRVLLDMPDLLPRVAHVFLFGVPSLGFPSVALRGSGVSELFQKGMGPLDADGRLITGLRRDWSDRFGTKPPFAFYSIAGDKDTNVPAESSLAPFPENQRRVVPGNHRSMIQPNDANAPVVQLVVTAVGGASESRGGHDIFLSYAGEDLPRIRPLVEALRAHGWSVFWDTTILLPGEKWRTKYARVRDELDAARCVIVLWSNNSVKSHWVRDEAQRGLSRGILVPAMIDHVGIPLGFQGLQAANLISGDRSDDDHEFQKMLRAVEIHVPLRTADLVSGARVEGPMEVVNVIEQWPQDQPAKLARPKVFLAYSSRDRARIRPVVEALEGRGWIVFWDTTLLPGETWRKKIESELDAALCVVALWSKASIESHWVHEEAEQGQRRGILVPVMIDSVKIPLGFRSLQAVNLIGWDGSADHDEFEKMLRAISLHAPIGEVAQLAPEDWRVLVNALCDVPQFQTEQTRQTFVQTVFAGQTNAKDMEKALQWVNWEGSQLVVANEVVRHVERMRALRVLVEAIEPLTAIKNQAELAALRQRMGWVAAQPLPKPAAGDVYDVLLCHNSRDKAEVRRIAEMLTQRGLRPWLDESSLLPEMPWRREVEKLSETAKSAAVFLGAYGLGEWQKKEVYAILSKFKERDCPVIPVYLAGAPGDARFTGSLDARTGVDFRRANPDPLNQLIWGITGVRSGRMTPGLRQRFEILLRGLPQWGDEDRRHVLLRGILREREVWDYLQTEGSVAVSAGVLFDTCEERDPEALCVLLDRLREVTKNDPGRSKEIEFLTGQLCGGAAVQRRGIWDGDPRPGVGVRHGVPDILWRTISGGTVEIEGHGAFQVGPFQMAAYPITAAQFRAFVNAADGYEAQRWWKGLEKNGPESRWQSLPGDHPITLVSWYDATAFCRWLNEKLGLEVRLPDEWEWQRAAQSERGFAYPWGPDWREGHANTSEAGIKGATVVGMFPQGDSLQQVSDLAGNVWEWCRNEYSKPRKTGEGGGVRGESPAREEPSRVLRGGSWYRNRDYARAENRDDFHPVKRDDGIGFRVVVLSPVRNRATGGSQ